MTFSEILESAKNGFIRAWDRMVFLVRTYAKTAVIIFLLLSVSLVFWARSGFSLEIGRFFASEDGDGSPTPTPTPTPSPSATGPMKKAGWLYCDYKTKTGACSQAPASGIGGISTDYDAQDCSGATDSACQLGSCRKREGIGFKLSDWVALDTPANSPACEPISKIDAVGFPGFGAPFYREGGGSTPGNVTPQPMDPAPTDYPDCLYLENGYGSSDPNFGSTTGNTIPQILHDRPNAKLIYKAFIINNCPWEVHLYLGLSGSAKADFTNGLGNRGSIGDEEGTLVNDQTANGHDFQSCWNNGSNPRSETCGKLISMEFNLNTYTCGSVGIIIDWWHRYRNNASGGGNSQSDSYCDKAGRCETQTGRGTGIASVLNYGKDCTGAPSERAPGRLGATPLPPPNTCTSALPAPAKLTVRCGTTSNVLTWTTEAKACQVGILRSVDGGNAAFIANAPPFPAITYTDTSIQTGHSYTYRIKNHPAVNSNSVTCKDGVQITTSPTPSGGVSPTPSGGVTPTPSGFSTPQPTSTFGGSPTPTVIVIGPTPTVIVDPTDPDLDDDGIPNDVECPGYVAGSDPMTCPDSDDDGVPDILDQDSDNDGIPDSQDCDRTNAGTQCPGGSGGPGGVQTGPGDATLLALIVSAVVSLVYVSYTHSPVAKRREVEVISKDQGPMDFRS